MEKHGGTPTFHLIPEANSPARPNCHGSSLASKSPRRSWLMAELILILRLILMPMLMPLADGWPLDLVHTELAKRPGKQHEKILNEPQNCAAGRAGK